MRTTFAFAVSTCPRLSKRQQTILSEICEEIHARHTDVQDCTFRGRMMFIKDLQHCNEFLAGDSTILSELLHPEKEELSLRYSLAHATLHPQKQSQRHSLKTSEVYYILEGRGRMHIDDDSAVVTPGQTIYIPPHAQQFIENTGTSDLKFLCIVDPAWRKEDEEIFEKPVVPLI